MLMNSERTNRGVVQRWTELLVSVNKNNDFDKLAICDITNGKVWAEIGDFKLYDNYYPNTDIKSKTQDKDLEEDSSHGDGPINEETILIESDLRSILQKSKKGHLL